MRLHWIKWYPVQWLHSTARDEMSVEERATFHDFVCLAAVSSIPGQFKFVNAESLSRQLNTDVKIIEKTLICCKNKNRLKITKTKEGFVCKITKWHIYQPVTEMKGVNNKQENIDLKLTLREEKKREEKKREEYSKLFEKFWREYPRKKEKRVAFDVFSKLKKSEQEQVIVCARNYHEEVKNKKIEESYIKHPATFLRKERWKDYIKQKVNPTQKEFDELLEKIESKNKGKK